MPRCSAKVHTKWHMTVTKAIIASRLIITFVSFLCTFEQNEFDNQGVYTYLHVPVHVHEQPQVANTSKCTCGDIFSTCSLHYLHVIAWCEISTPVKASCNYPVILAASFQWSRAERKGWKCDYFRSALSHALMTYVSGGDLCRLTNTR